jgi:hypothetical protein
MLIPKSGANSIAHLTPLDGVNKVPNLPISLLLKIITWIPYFVASYNSDQIFLEFRHVFTL